MLMKDSDVSNYGVMLSPVPPTRNREVNVDSGLLSTISDLILSANHIVNLRGQLTEIECSQLSVPGACPRV